MSERELDQYVTWDAPCYLCNTRPSVFNLVIGGTAGPLCLDCGRELGLEPAQRLDEGTGPDAGPVA